VGCVTQQAAPWPEEQQQQQQPTSFIESSITRRPRLQLLIATGNALLVESRQG